MTERLAINHFFMQAEELSAQIIDGFQNIEKDVDLVVLPEPTLAVLEEFGVAPDDLRNDGEDVPADEDEALEFALEKFRYSDNFYEWQESLRPGDGMLYLWPLELPPGYDDPTDPLYAPFDHQGLANKMLENNLNCCYISGEHQGRTYQGFILTGGGSNFSPDLAISYVFAGQVPPHTLLDNALTNTDNDDWREIFLDCIQLGRDYMQSQVDSYQRTLDMYRPSHPSLT